MQCGDKEKGWKIPFIHGVGRKEIFVVKKSQEDVRSDNGKVVAVRVGKDKRVERKSMKRKDRISEKVYYKD